MSNIPVSYWYCGLYALLCVVICPLMAYLGKGPVRRYIESKPGVWAGGDIVTGAATVILAMGAGRTASQDMDKWLSSGSKEWL